MLEAGLEGFNGSYLLLAAASYGLDLVFEGLGSVTGGLVGVVKGVGGRGGIGGEGGGGGGWVSAFKFFVVVEGVVGVGGGGGAQTVEIFQGECRVLEG